MGIPTILIKGSGSEKGHFNNFRGMVDLDTQQIFDEIERQYKSGRDIDFIRDTVEGGDEFNSTEKFLDCVGKIIWF